ncbi:uncharacterized protein LOC134699144 [Mytilus trossulus]|uniref:uncharacterized protein LOC134699144 n=1 Tax=Mytilus trossulus TaxID=6551 RepID=UPI003004E366
MQDRTYTRALSNRENLTRITFSSDDPTKLVMTDNGIVTGVEECFIRSSPFIILRRDIPGNGTHSEYCCRKDAKYDDSENIRVTHYDQWKVFRDYPHLCDVCTGIDLTGTRAFAGCAIEIGCNIPLVCPVTMEGQVQCGCDDMGKPENGFCCDDMP